VTVEGFASTIDRRRKVFTMGQRINVTALGLYSTGLGLTYALGDPLRFSAISFETLRTIYPMRVHGIVFTILGVALLAAYLHGRWIEYVLAALAGYQIMFAAAFAIVAFEYPKASPSGVWPYLFIATSCVASIASTVQAKREAYLESKLVQEYDDLVALAKAHRLAQGE